MTFRCIILLAWLTLAWSTIAIASQSPRDTLNTCIASSYHKKVPTPEQDLVECKPWKARSCCTPATVKELSLTANQVLYNFRWDHCGNLSSQCYRYMVQDSCFYECSPNVGPWIVNASSSRRSERFMHVPICASFCDNWFAACENDKTCSGDWRYDWKWINRSNHCKANNTCKTFGQIFKTSKGFCEGLWHYSFKYQSDDKPCMKPWFETAANPNSDVAKYYHNINAAQSSTLASSYLLLIIGFLVMHLSTNNMSTML
ncbi:Folate receptor gamma [Trichoplax sp. H2]|nr:Folate receptor gamma [Trichoplax sp. H2]|eukprot:RDD39469.1 Folate receptor gamma [Trichoplax sp. H2]